MISSREEILDLLQSYECIANERQKNLYDKKSDWTEKKECLYNFGEVLGKFRESDYLTMETLRIGVEDSALETEINKNKKNEQKNILNSDNILYLNTCKFYKTNNLDDWIKQKKVELSEFEKKIIELQNSEFRVLIYLEYVLKNIRYEESCPYNPDLKNIKSIYKNKFKKDSQFKKYDLLPIDKNRELLILEPPRIYDKIVDKTIFIRNIPKELLAEIYKMKKDDTNMDFAIGPSNKSFFDGRYENQILHEEVERGKIFDLSNLKSKSITKLYCHTYGNCLWINIDSENITFEELCEDIQEYNGMVVTQVIHLEYIRDLKDAYITHLDHEYIYYTKEEYDVRVNDVSKKGEGHTRLKSFKIDNAKIPFLKECIINNKDKTGKQLPKSQEQFLYYVLDCYFEHKELLKEYFGKI